MPKELFEIEDISAEVSKKIKAVPDNIKRLFAVIGSECPSCEVGEHCLKPYDCPLRGECWEFMPKDNVFTLCGGKRKAFDLYDADILSLNKIPDGYKLNDKQKIQVKCDKTGKPHIDKRKITEFIKKIEYPVCVLDFETLGVAVPLYNKTRPYQNIPFQYSLHIVRKKGAEPEHHSFLAETGKDPRPLLLHSLKDDLLDSGTILAYNQSFEIGVLDELSKAFPHYKAWIRPLIPRFVDLLDPFRSFHYYDPRQMGSASVKAVLPVLTDRTYENLPINNGQSASLSFYKITFGDEGRLPDKSEITKIRKELEEYCALDTEGLLVILDRLEGEVG